MPSEVEIANRACAAAGTKSTITSLAENSKEAKAASLLLPGVRDAGLEMAPWDFARATATLALLKAKPGTPENPTASSSTLWQTSWPPPPWLYEYSMPVNCIRMRWVLPQLEGMPYPYPPAKFTRASDLITTAPVQVILTNARQPVAVYTRSMDDPNTWPPLFTEMIVMALAAKLSIPLSGDQKLAAGNLAAANGMLLNARISDGNEAYQQIDYLPATLRARDSWPYPYEPPDPLIFTGLFTMS